MMDKLGSRQYEGGYLALAVGVHAAIGASMVPMRYLQTVAGLPGLALVALSDIVAFVIMSGFVFPRINKVYWRSKTLWVMVAVVVVRTILLIFALRFTKAYIVQLITLLAPFIVVLLNRFFTRTPLPKNTIPAITLSLMGGALMIFGDLTGQSLELAWTGEDSLGILCAFLATFGIAAYMVIVKRGQQIGLPFEIVYISQVGTMMMLMPILSLWIGEDWSPFMTVDWRAGLAFLFNAIGVEIGCKIGNITILRKLGAPIVSSMLAVRLVATLFLGWIFLGEKLVSPLQWVGAFLVVVTVTIFLSRQG